jgi:hypothetical protein
MSLLSLFSEERCMDRREKLIAAIFTMRGLTTWFQATLPCWERLSWRAPKPGKFSGMKPFSEPTE